VLITNLSPLAPNQQLRRHFSLHGNLVSFEPQIDKENGSALGIVFIKYNTNEEAKRCVAKENGKKLGLGSGLGLGMGVGSSDEIKVVFDGDGSKLKAVLRELDDKKRGLREEKKRREKESKLREANASLALNVNAKLSSTPNSSNAPPSQSPLPESHQSTSSRQVHPLPLNPQLNGVPPPDLPRPRRPPAPALVQARMMVLSSHLGQDSTHSSSSTPLPGRSHHLSHPADASRSPSPTSRKPVQASESEKQKEHEDVVAELIKNGMDHVGLETGAAVTEEDMQKFFEGFKVQKVRVDRFAFSGVYIYSIPPMHARFCVTTLVGM
jgi:hypothetical protein